MRTRGLLFPVVLVTLGILFLLRNLGVLDWNLGDILRAWWPVLVILLGLDLLLGRRLWSTVGVLFVLAAIGIGAFFWIQSSTHAGLGTRIEGFSVPLGDAPAAEVALGSERPWRLHFAPGQDPEALVQGTATLGWGEALREMVTIEASGTQVSLRARGASEIAWPHHRREFAWQVFLTPTVPLRLTVEAAGGHTELDLSALRVTNLHLALGGGEGAVSLPVATSLRGSVDAERGHLTVRVRPPTALRLRLDGVPEEIRVPESFLPTQDGWKAPGYADAAVTADLTVRAREAIVVIEEEI
ncbi:MAG: DUF5668 domain-containing protein [Candidatus Bipolaricaulota bacterium]